jgi:hypothetical protein
MAVLTQDCRCVLIDGLMRVAQRYRMYNLDGTLEPGEDTVCVLRYVLASGKKISRLAVLGLSPVNHVDLLSENEKIIGGTTCTPQQFMSYPRSVSNLMINN